MLLQSATPDQNQENAEELLDQESHLLQQSEALAQHILVEGCEEDEELKDERAKLVGLRKELKY